MEKTIFLNHEVLFFQQDIFIVVQPIVDRTLDLPTVFPWRARSLYGHPFCPLTVSVCHIGPKAPLLSSLTQVGSVIPVTPWILPPRHISKSGSRTQVIILVCVLNLLPLWPLALFQKCKNCIANAIPSYPFAF